MNNLINDLFNIIDITLIDLNEDKVYLYVLRYYILYAKLVFQWRSTGGEMNRHLCPQPVTIRM